MAGAVEFRDPRLTVSDAHAPSLLLHEPLIPGTGVDNALAWADLGIEGTPTTAQIEDAAWNALAAYLDRSQALRVDRAELGTPRVTVHDGGQFVQVYVPRRLGGVPVRDSALVAAINHGNLVLLGLSHWANAMAARPTVSPDQARQVVAAHVRGRVLAAGTPRLEYLPFAHLPPAEGYGLRLAWVVGGRLQGDHGNWEGLVDAASGELLAFEDRNQYATAKKLFGGVYPLSNDGLPTDGVEQPDYPMPFADVRLPDGSTVFTNSAGLAGCVGAPAPGGGGRGLMRTTLAGRYMRIADNCGLVREKWIAASELAGDLGFGPGLNCAVPPGHSAGDTHAARTAFYELNRMAEQARGYLPANTWLQAPLLVNVNFNASCGAGWSGSHVVYYRDGGICRNAGEIAGVLDHEWGHGMDDNGADPTISNPAEAIADIHAALRLNESCVGRGFFKTGVCGGYGDACTTCTGVRDLDWAKHQSGLPHDIAWVQMRCPSGTAPCGKQVHCAGIPIAEALWDLHARDLPAQFGLDANSALEVATRLVYLGGGLVGTWYQCTPPSGGCGATGGYLNLLAADDDNGNLADGTPHLTAIHTAFNRHQIACNVPPPTSSGCAGGPTTAPLLAATPQDQGVALSWTPVSGAARYVIYRAEGVRGCEIGKTKAAEVTGTSFTDLGLRNGFDYFYTVLPVGANSSCFGPMSTCQPAVPSGSGICTP